jgi:TonB-dependent receptor
MTSATNTLDYHVGYTRGTYEKPYDLNSSFENGTAAVATYDNTTRPNWPVLSVTGVNPYEPAGYVLTGLSNQSQHSNDHEWGIGINMTVPTEFTQAQNENIKFGVNARLRNRVATAQNLAPDSIPALPLDQVVFGNNVLFYQGHYLNGPQIDGSVLRTLYASSTIVDDTASDAGSYQNDREDVYALYGQYQFGFGPLGIVAGARAENTRATYTANLIDDSGANTVITPISRDKSYTNFLPSAQARYEIAPDLIGRLAVSSTIARPGFNQVTAATTIDPGGSVSTGNPNLKPITATGIDLSIERYLKQAGIVSLGVFDKEIRNYIVTQEANLPVPAQGGFVGLARTFTFTNASSSRAFGVEANYVQHFRELLPGPLAGLGVSANWTWVQSRFDIRPGEISVLPSTSRNTFNAELLYDLNPVNLTLGAYYTSRNIFGVGSSAATDIWTQERLSVDFGSQYRISDAFSVYFNARNLTSTALKITEGPADNRLIQREFYGVTLQAGVNIKL